MSSDLDVLVVALAVSLALMYFVIYFAVLNAIRASKKPTKVYADD